MGVVVGGVVWLVVYVVVFVVKFLEGCYFVCKFGVRGVNFVVEVFDVDVLVFEVCCLGSWSVDLLEVGGGVGGC